MACVWHSQNAVTNQPNTQLQQYSYTTCPQVSYLQVQSLIQTSDILSTPVNLTKPHPLFAYQKSVLAVQMAHIKCFRAQSSHCMTAGDTKQPIGFATQVHCTCQTSYSSKLLGTVWCTENWVMTYSCIHSSTSYLPEVRSQTCCIARGCCITYQWQQHVNGRLAL